MEEEILNTVESLFGKDVKIVDCETSSSVQQEEILLINGVPIKLDGIADEDAKAIKSALLDGQMPAVEHLNQLLLRAGLSQQPVEVETSLTVKSSVTTTEEVLVSRNGQVLDERTIETKEHFNHQSLQKEMWQPIKDNTLSRNTPAKLCENLNAIKLQNSSNSTVSSDCNAGRSEQLSADVSRNSYGVNHTWSNASGTTASLISSSSAYADSDQVIGSVSNVSTAPTIGDFSVKSSNFSSCDSGHDGLFHSASLTAPWTKGLRDTQTDSLYCDIASSADEADFVSAATASTEFPKSNEKATDGESSILNSLTALLLPVNTSADEQTLFICILCSRLFCEPHEFLANCNAKLRSCHDSSETTKRLINMLRSWMEICPNDFHNEKFIETFRSMTPTHGQLNTAVASEIEKFTFDIADKLKNFDLKRRENAEHILLKKTSSSSSLGRQSSIKSLKRFASNACKSNNILGICNSAKQLAHQLTVIDHAYLSHLRPEEFLEMLRAEQQQQTSVNHVEPRINIKSYGAWFNRLSYLTATEIVKLNKKSQRTQMIEFWIETAMECFNIGNFNSLMAILTGLNLTAVSRLKKTWNKVETSKFSGLEHQMDPSSNFSSYRSSMKAAVWRSERASGNEHERAIIPFFTLFLKDLYFINENNAAVSTNVQSIIDKCIQFGNLLRDFVKWQQTACSYEILPKVNGYLQSADVYAEEALMKASYTCETPETTEEKAHYKALKAEKG